MDYMEYNASRSIKKKLTAVVIMISLAVALSVVTKTVLEVHYEELRVSLDSTSSLARKITSTEAEKAGYEEVLDESR